MLLKQYIMGLIAIYCLQTIRMVKGDSFHAGLILPSMDPFYILPSGYERTKPGTILRSRKLPRHPEQTLPAFPQNIRGAYQLLYRTTDALGQPTATVTTLMIPFNANPRKLVTYAVIQDNVSADCAPSYILQKEFNSRDILPQSEVLFMDTMLARGWYVSMPDYQGPKSMFTVGEMAGNGLLDSIRAVLASHVETGIRPDAKIQMWGYSGGALATGWAAQLQPRYAPELNIMSAVLGGTPVDLNATLYSVNQAFFSGLGFSGILGVAAQYDDFAAYVDAMLVPEKKQAFYKVRELCYGDLVGNYTMQDITTYFAHPDFAQASVVKNMLAKSDMGNIDTPTIPIFAYHAEHDPIAPFELTAAVYKKWCQQGARIELLTDQTLDHSRLILGGAADAILYLERRFAGIPPRRGCPHRSTRDASHDPFTSFVYMRALWDILRAVIGKAPFHIHRQ
ncbi:secretory lipase family protein [Halteromyces radiatus]|uniref:secretory lipase family protein n=1 Tax=Halteromyces radiatus TaxID=101107 RepID=UPI00221F5060|nr:secretory lipase family protein [Halteromyces radiatus]KAI8081466.1 secretory lipase family protein [Halteromyces radiatus]